MRSTALICLLIFTGCAADSAERIAPDLYPGASHSITVEGPGLVAVDYSDSPYLFGDGVDCEYSVTDTEGAVTVDVDCYATPATDGLIPSAVVDVYSRTDGYVATIVLDTRG